MRLQSDTSEGQQDTKKPVHFQNHLSCTERSIHTTLESSKTSMLKNSRNKQKDSHLCYVLTINESRVPKNWTKLSKWNCNWMSAIARNIISQKNAYLYRLHNQTIHQETYSYLWHPCAGLQVIRVSIKGRQHLQTTAKMIKQSRIHCSCGMLKYFFLIISITTEEMSMFTIST